MDLNTTISANFSSKQNIVDNEDPCIPLTVVFKLSILKHIEVCNCLGGGDILLTDRVLHIISTRIIIGPGPLAT